MKRFGLADRFRDQALEQGVLAAMTRDPQLYWTLLDFLAPGTLVYEGEAWARVRAAVEKDAAPGVLADAVPAEWPPSADPAGDAERLADLHQRRLLAGTQERLAEALNDDNISGKDLAARLEEEALKAQRAIRELDSGRLQLASGLVASVLSDAQERYDARQLTRDPIMGIKTGIRELDKITGGLEEGVYFLAAGPSVGKTTLATQLAGVVAGGGDPVVYVTYENSDANLVTKMLCARASINMGDVRRGEADVGGLRQAAQELAPTLDRIAFIEGTGRLTVPEVRGRALQMMHRTGSERCLVVVDYLQLWAKASAEYRGMASARERVEALTAELKELSKRLKNPVLAIVSQNRAQGNYGTDGKGSPTIDSLKESGDLEYAADLVMFLHKSQDRTAPEPTRAVDLTIGKWRHGELGKIELVFRADTGVMREATQAVASR